MSPHLKGLILTALGVLCVVPDALLTRLIGAPALTVAFWRAGLSGLAVGGYVLATMRPGALGAVFAQGWPVAIYGAGIGVSGLLFVIAVQATLVAHVVLAIATMPLVAAIFGRIFLGERIGPRLIATMLGVAIGLVIVAAGTGNTPGPGRATLAGDLAAVGVIIAFAAALTAARKVRAVSLVPVIPLANLAVAALIWPFAHPLAVPAGHWPLVALHGGVFIALSTALLSLGPRYLAPAEVALLILLEVVLAPLLVWAVLDEALAPATLVGGGLVVASLVISNLVALTRSRRG